MSDCPSCLNGCGGARSDCPKREGGQVSLAPRGRPLTYKPDVALEICRRLATGETLKGICRDEGMPHESTVRGWAVADVDGFATLFARARECQAHALADAALDEAQRAEDPQLGRLAFDARKWFVGKSLPKVYGDKVQTEGPGPNGEHTTRVVLDWAKPAEPDPTEP